MIRTLIPVIVCSLLLGPGCTGAVGAVSTVDVRQIVGHTPAEVARLLGPPGYQRVHSLDELGRRVVETSIGYHHDAITVIYRAGRADGVYYRFADDLESVPFTPALLRNIGLRPTRPTFANSLTLRWDHYSDFRFVMALRYPPAGNTAAIIVDGYRGD